MALKLSTGLRNAMLDSSNLRTTMNGGLIKVYDGTVPATADAALSGNTLLCTFSLNSTGAGINFDTTATGDTLAKAPAEVWAGDPAATGTATFYRHVASGDDGTLSTTQARIQGEVGPGHEMILATSVFTVGVNRELDFYTITFPTL
jgi:hypothetical protein